MDSYRNGIASQRALRKQDRRSQDALGLVSTLSFPVVVSTADAMLKAASVTLVGYEKTGSGQCTAIVRGTIAEVRIAVEAGVERARQEGRLHSSTLLARPFPNLEVVFPIGSKLLEQLSGANHGRVSNQALGLLETRGFPAMVGAADAMLKAADVQLSAYETIGDGLCTAIIRGAVANVAMALQVGIAEAQRIGELIAVTVIPRPLEDLEKSLPVAQCLIEAEPQPLALPIKVKEEVKELVELPDLGKLPMSIKDS